MSKLSLLVCGLVVAMPLSVVADNIIRTQAPIRYAENPGAPSEGDWIAASPSYSAWVNQGEVEDCGDWLPSADSARMDTLVEQTAFCKQTQSRNVQPREQQRGTQNYRNVGAAYEESQVVQVESQREVHGSVAKSCLMHKQYAGATANGVYSIQIGERSVSVMCDMAAGGWTVVGRGHQEDVREWATTRDAVNPGQIPGQNGTVTAKLSDADINAIPKTAYKVVTSGYNNTRYFKGSCVYNHLQTASGDCAISYSDESWSNPRGNGLASSGWAGLCDNRASVANDGIYIYTSAPTSPAYGWAAGDGTVVSNTGNALLGTRVSQYIYVR